jgi:Ca-activated chloride channel family protein
MDFQFASPWLLTLLLLVPAILWWHRRGNGRQRPAGLRFASLAAAQMSGRTWRMRLRPLQTILRMAALALLVLGLARPQSVQAREVIHGEGVDIALALDISGSMASLDFQPQNRLEAAKDVISDFVAERPYDQIGLVVFASNAFNQSPLTVDHNVLDRSCWARRSWPPHMASRTARPSAWGWPTPPTWWPTPTPRARW